MKVKSLPDLEKRLVGYRIPDYIITKLKDDPGAVGKHIEDMIEHWGYPVNRREGCDLSVFDVEVKTRCSAATSAQTVGGMTIDNIKSTLYEDSTICPKIQRQFKVKWDRDFRTVTEAGIMDYSKPEVQKKIKSAYETGRQEIINGNIATGYARGVGEWAYFEEQPGGSWQFRIPNKRMDDLEGMTRTVNIFELQ